MVRSAFRFIMEILMLENILHSEDERLDTVNDSIKLIQRKNGLTFGTDALLLASFINEKNKCAAELGAGTGIISLLLLSREKAKHIYAYEVQEQFAELTQRNARLNGYSDSLTVHLKDVRDATPAENGGELDYLFSNPPYMKNGTGLSNYRDEKNIARREVFGTIEDFCMCAKKLLKFGGRFYSVYRPDRLASLIFALKRASIEPKRITFVHPCSDTPPSLVLIEARLGGGEELKITKPLIIYKNKKHTDYTDDMKNIYDIGSFPEDFYK